MSSRLLEASLASSHFSLLCSSSFIFLPLILVLLPTFAMNLLAAIPTGPSPGLSAPLTFANIFRVQSLLSPAKCQQGQQAFLPNHLPHSREKNFISLLWIEVTSWLGLTNKQSKWNNTDPVASFAPGINSLRTVLFNPFT